MRILLILAGFVDCVNNTCESVSAGAQSLGVCQAAATSTMVHTGRLQGESSI